MASDPSFNQFRGACILPSYYSTLDGKCGCVYLAGLTSKVVVAISEFGGVICTAFGDMASESVFF